MASKITREEARQIAMLSPFGGGSTEIKGIICLGGKCLCYELRSCCTGNNEDIINYISSVDTEEHPTQ